MSAKPQTILVLVESPAKCSKIESYLGPGYRCIATYGHFRELDGLKSIDVKNNFKLTFVSMTEKMKQIHLIRTVMAECPGGIIIATDDKYHNIVLQLLQNCPNARILDCDEITTFQFGSTCKNIILSHGSFSATLGYLSFYSTIYYPIYNKNKMWYGDMFSIKNWVQCAS